VFQLKGDLRRIPLRRGSHITGFQPLPTGAVEHESALERDFVTLTSFTDPGATITSQPVTMQFDHQGERRKYTPDFLVRWSDGHGDLVEISIGRTCASSGLAFARPSSRRATGRAGMMRVSSSSRSVVFAASD
jgi:hypothetical protein